jgi:membrane-bound lytic murein transglycosylase D
MRSGKTIAALIVATVLIPCLAIAQSFDSGIRVVGTVQPSGAAAHSAPQTVINSGLANRVISDPYLFAAPSSVGSGFAFIHNAPHRVAPFPIVLNEAVQRYVDAMLAHPAGLTESFERSRPFMVDMVRVLEHEGLPRDLVYLAFAESQFSQAGAGPWQLTKATARRFGLVVNSSLDERRDPVLSTKAAAEYLATLHDETKDWRVTLIGWNRGEAGLDRFLSLRGADYELLIREIPSSTRALINRFMAVAVIAHKARQYGLQAITFTTDEKFYQRIKVKGGTSLTAVARRYNTSPARLRFLNPALLQDRVPSHVRSFELRVPLQQNAAISSSSTS